MRIARTLSVSVRRAPRAVYEFVADPTNLPHWAPGFCRAVRHDGAAWVVETPQGAVGFHFAERNALGVLDHHVRPAAGPEVYVPMRVVPNADGSEVLFTLFRAPDASDEEFAADARVVAQDLARLRAVLEARPA